MDPKRSVIKRLHCNSELIIITIYDDPTGESFLSCANSNGCNEAAYHIAMSFHDSEIS